jgi:hypothetical protein
MLHHWVAVFLGHRFAVFSCLTLGTKLCWNWFSWAECAGTWRRANAGHHWCFCSNPALRGPGFLTSNSRCVFYLYEVGSPLFHLQLCFYNTIHIHAFTENQFNSFTPPSLAITLTYLLLVGFSQRPLLALLSGKRPFPDNTCGICPRGSKPTKPAWPSTVTSVISLPNMTAYLHCMAPFLQMARWHINY